MAARIPTQNNLNDVIKASTELLKEVREAISSRKKQEKKDTSIDVKKDLAHIKTDVQFVVEFVKDMGDVIKNIDNVTDKLVAVLGMPSKINKKLASVKVEVIDAKNVQKATTELMRFLNTPAEINMILASNEETIKWRTIRSTIDQLLLICRTPEYINKHLNNFKVGKIDQKRINTIKQSLNMVFGKGGLMDNIEKVTKRLKTFRGLSAKKSLTLWTSIFYLNIITGQIVRFGRYSNRHAAELKLAIAGSTLILKFIGEFAETLQDVDKLGLTTLLILPIKIKLLGRIVRRITRLMGDMVNLVWYLPVTSLITATVSTINKALIKFVSMLDTIDKFNLSTLVVLTIKVPILAHVTRSISRRLIPALIAFNRHLKGMLIAIIGLMIAEKLLIKLSDIIQVVTKIKLTVLIVNLLKIKLLATNARLISNLIIRIGRLANIALRYMMAITGLSVALVMVTLFSNIVLTIRKTKIGIFFKIKVRQLILGARLIRNLIHIIARIISARRAAKALLAVKLVNMIIKSFASVILNILLLTPLMVLFIMFSPIIIVVFWLFAKIFRIIVRILAKLVSPQVVMVLVAVTGVIVMMVMLGLALVALGLIAMVIVDNALNILLFFGVVIAVALLLGLLGLVLAKVSPLMMAAVYGIGMVALTVFAVLAIAAMLWLLAKIELDEEKIKENVRKIMSTVMFIITSLFEDELNDPEGRDSVFTKILKVLGGAVAKIIMALATCVVLVATFVSVACILMIAVMLRMLQNLDLDKSKILANVDKVFDTVEQIIARFMADDPKGTKSNRGILITVMSWACPPLAKIAEALLSLAYLFLMFLAVSLVLGIASMLRLLQNLDLHTDEIQDNVDTVFNTVDQIINRIFGDREDKEHPSKRGILVTIISWVDEGLAKIVEAALSIIYLALAFQAVALTLAIASMLRLLQNLNLQEDIIRANTDIVFNTVELIINRIFGDRKDEEHPSKRGILVTIISWVDPGLANIVEAALSIIYLMLALVAISIVLGIAGLLSCIEKINLNYEDIKKTIDATFDTIDLIINRVFAPAKGDMIAGNGVLGKIIGLFNPGLAKIIDALMAIAYVGLAFVAISIVKGIAENLEEIQNIDIDCGKIATKVDTIFTTVAHIMKQIYEKSDTLLPKPKNRGIFGSIISFFSPGLADILDALTMIAKLAVVQTAISAVAGIGSSLKQIQDLQVDLSSASDKVDKIMGVAESVCEKIFSRESKIKFPVPPEERKSVFGALISWAFGGKSDEDRALEAAMKKVEALGIIEAAVGALGNILEGAKRIVDMNVTDLTSAQSKVDEVMEMATHLSESIFGSDVKLTLPEPSNDDIKAALVELGYDHWYRSSNAGEKAAATAHAQMKLAMKRVETLGLIASAVGSIASIIDGINKIKDYNVPNLATVRKNVQDIMTTASQVSFIIFNQNGIGQSGGNAAGIRSQIEDIKARIDFAKAGSDGVALVCESFANLIEKAKFDESQVATTKAKVSSSITAIGEIISQMDGIQPTKYGENIHKNCELIDRISETVGSFVQVTPEDVKNSQAITENYIKFFKQIDSMDIKKLQHTDWLMRSWASISRDLKGDFEGLAKTINQHIMPMLEKVNETLDKTTKTQQEIINTLSQPVDINGAGSTGGSTFDMPNTTTSNTTPDLSAPSSQMGRDDSAQAGKNIQPTPVPGGAGSAPKTNDRALKLESGKKYRIKVSEVKEGW